MKNLISIVILTILCSITTASFAQFDEAAATKRVNEMMASYDGVIDSLMNERLLDENSGEDYWKPTDQGILFLMHPDAGVTEEELIISIKIRNIDDARSLATHPDHEMHEIPLITRVEFEPWPEVFVTNNVGARVTASTLDPYEPLTESSSRIWMRNLMDSLQCSHLVVVGDDSADTQALQKCNYEYDKYNVSVLNPKGRDGHTNFQLLSNSQGLSHEFAHNEGCNHTTGENQNCDYGNYAEYIGPGEMSRVTGTNGYGGTLKYSQSRGGRMFSVANRDAIIYSYTSIRNWMSIEIAGAIDNDGDGFNSDEDCDDDNPNVNPDQAEEPYNGLDDDCDSSTLDDDLDQDGFLLAEDCDDDNSNINPDQIEEPYNGIDDDCNMSTLDDDLDQDGFLIADDCDDNNADINPDADEIPNNGIDEDCDGMDFMTSTHEISNTTVSIYPNPASDVINIEVDGHLNLFSTLYDIEGKTIINTKKTKLIGVNSIPTGMYLLEIKDMTSGQKVVERIMIGR